MIVLACTACACSTPSSSPTPGRVATATVLHVRPVPNSNVTVSGSLKAAGKPVAGARRTATWRAVGTTSTCIGTTNAAGVASCTRKIARPTVGYPAKITVTFTQAGKALGSAVPGFTPREGATFRRGAACSRRVFSLPSGGNAPPARAAVRHGIWTTLRAQGRTARTADWREYAASVAKPLQLLFAAGL